MKSTIVSATKDAYDQLGAATAGDFEVNAAHGWPSPVATSSCSFSFSPYMINCNNFDVAKKFLEHALPERGPYESAGSPSESRLFRFDQTQFIPSDAGSDHEMADYGYFYEPAACATQSCAIVFAIHGCQQAFRSLGDKFIKLSGLNEWAESNNLIVVYPQSSGSLDCWDWTGRYLLLLLFFFSFCVLVKFTDFCLFVCF